MKPEKTAKLGDVDFGHRAPPKQITLNVDNNAAHGGYDPHSIFTSLRSSETNDNNNNNLGDTLSAYTESSSYSKPIAEENDGEAAEGLPGPPQDLKAAIVKARFVTLSWQAPVFTNGEIITYSVYYRQEGSER